jgi:hypothetical protein
MYVHTYNYLFKSLLDLRQAPRIMNHHRRGTSFDHVRKIELPLYFNKYISIIDSSPMELQNRIPNAGL